MATLWSSARYDCGFAPTRRPWVRACCARSRPRMVRAALLRSERPDRIEVVTKRQHKGVLAMSSDPGNGNGDSGDDDLEGRKTRVVPRSDILDRSASGRGPATKEAAKDDAAYEEPAAPTGTIIG